MDRLRVEEVAERADVSVDTIRFYQKRHLLGPPQREGRVAWYGPEHLQRLARIRELRAQGLTLALIGRVLSGDLDETDAPLAIAVADAESPEEFLSLAELAERSAVPPALLESVVREGLLVARLHDGDERYTKADVDVVRAGLALLEAGFPLTDLLTLAREHNASTHAIAEQAVALFDRHVRVPLRTSELSDREKAERLVDAFRALLPAVTSLVEHHFRRVLLAVAQAHLDSVGEKHEIAAASVEAARRLEAGPTRSGRNP